MSRASSSANSVTAASGRTYRAVESYRSPQRLGRLGSVDGGRWQRSAPPGRSDGGGPPGGLRSTGVRGQEHRNRLPSRSGLRQLARNSAGRRTGLACSRREVHAGEHVRPGVAAHEVDLVELARGGPPGQLPYPVTLLREKAVESPPGGNAVQLAAPRGLYRADRSAYVCLSVRRTGRISAGSTLLPLRPRRTVRLLLVLRTFAPRPLLSIGAPRTNLVRSSRGAHENRGTTR